MKLQTKIIALLFCLVSATFGLAQSAKLTAKDFISLSGSWKGTLTYLDYSSGKPYTMPADVSIAQIGNTNQFAFSNTYPDEPKANDVDTLTISQNGKMLNEAIVTAKRKLKNGDTQIVTERKGKDGNDNKPAIIRLTYTFGASAYTKRKDVKFIGKKVWIQRHEYSYTKN
jgi:hypothetical protein